MTPRDLLQKLMETHQPVPLNASSLAKATRNRTKQPQIYRFLHGATTEPKRSTMTPLAELFGVPVDAFFDPSVAKLVAIERWGAADTAPAFKGDAKTGHELRHKSTVSLNYAGMHNSPGRVPVSGVMRTASDGQFDLHPDDGQAYVLAAEPHPGAYALRVQGDGLAPSVRDGEFILVDPSRKATSGSRVVITMKDGRRLCKELLYERGRTVAVRNVTGGEPATLYLDDVLTIEPIFAIYAADRWAAG